MYNTKMMELLSDTDTYMQITNPVSTFIKKNKELAQKLHVKGYIDKDTKDSLINSYAHLEFTDYQNCTKTAFQ